MDPCTTLPMSMPAGAAGGSFLEMMLLWGLLVCIVFAAGVTIVYYLIRLPKEMPEKCILCNVCSATIEPGPDLIEMHGNRYAGDVLRFHQKCYTGSAFMQVFRDTDYSRARK